MLRAAAESKLAASCPSGEVVRLIMQGAQPSGANVEEVERRRSAVGEPAAEMLIRLDDD